ncbi:MAG: NUDIX domain-containing protein [Bdellovibrionota bacterium]|nr:MAG: NUDIX domain-containing protein [Bdellovibrionota bacterium]
MKRIIRTQEKLPWLPSPHTVRTYLGDEYPDLALVTAVFAFVFEGDKLLLAHREEVGDWDLLGGHIEAGETPEEALLREVYEEAGATLRSYELMGYLDVEVQAPRPANWPYPYPKSFMLIYLAEVGSIEHFDEGEEGPARSLFSPEEAIKLPAIRKEIELYEAALKERIRQLASLV